MGERDRIQFCFCHVYIIIKMGQCDVCTREAEYNAIDSDDLMIKLENTDLGNDINKLRADNRESITNFKFMPMPDRSFYKGKLSNTKRQGYGENYAGCFNYFGFFKNDLPHGQGAIITEKQCLLGNFQAGVLQGRGKQWSDGIFFEGVYKNGERVNGRLSSEDASYNGDFKREQYHGKGTLTLKNGTTYEGSFIDGQLKGQGQVTFSSGDKYKGPFKNGLYQGYGEYRWANGNLYRGEYKEGKRNGFGVLKIGDVEYSGTWKNNEREGHGILTKNTELAFGTWQHNVLVEQ